MGSWKQLWAYKICRAEVLSNATIRSLSFALGLEAVLRKSPEAWLQTRHENDLLYIDFFLLSTTSIYLVKFAQNLVKANFTKNAFSYPLTCHGPGIFLRQCHLSFLPIKIYRFICFFGINFLSAL